MSSQTNSAPLFRDDAYLRGVAATVAGIVGRDAERGGIVLDRTVFYATSGGQPGDSGTFRWDGGETPIVTTVKGEAQDEIVHVPADGAKLPPVGAHVETEIDWQRRYRLMRMHTCLHLLTSVVPYPVTGGQVGTHKGRLDFDIEDAALDKAALGAQLNRLIADDTPVTSRWITSAELEARPVLVKTMSVAPPTGADRIRLIEIAHVDLQPCGGTHVRATGEIGSVEIGKIENKGRHNRRVNVRFVDA